MRIKTDYYKLIIIYIPRLVVTNFYGIMTLKISLFLIIFLTMILDSKILSYDPNKPFNHPNLVSTQYTLTKSQPWKV